MKFSRVNWMCQMTGKLSNVQTYIINLIKSATTKSVLTEDGQLQRTNN